MKRSAAGLALKITGAFVLLCAGLRPLLPTGGMGLRTMRAEVPANVDGLLTVERAWDAAFDGFVACGSRAEAEAWLADQPSVSRWPHAVFLRWYFGAVPRVDAREWTSVPWRGCFDGLGWEPDGRVRGAYWVEVDGEAFTVHGICDIDDDGVTAHYRARFSPSYS